MTKVSRISVRDGPSTVCTIVFYGDGVRTPDGVDSQTFPRAHHTNPVPLAALLAAASRLARPSERATAPNRSRARKRPISIDSEEVSAGAEQFVVPVMASKARAALGGGGMCEE